MKLLKINMNGFTLVESKVSIDGPDKSTNYIDSSGKAFSEC